jgi:hypothetical protein
LVVPTDAPERSVRFQVEALFPFSQYHFMNVSEHGDDLVVDFVRVSDFGTAFKGTIWRTASPRRLLKGGCTGPS